VVKRIGPDHCAAILIDVQDFFLSQLQPRARSKMKSNFKNLARLLNYFRVPIVVMLERRVDAKGSLPEEINEHLTSHATFEKDFFDLTKEKKIRDHLGRLRRKQVIIAGCETDVCVLQSCLGLMGLGYEVYVVEDLLFSSSGDVGAAIARMQANAAAVFLSYKSLYYELLEAVEGGRHAEKMITTFGSFPSDLPDCSAQMSYACRSPREHFRSTSNS
jgi:nicotinamidase-related amidase